MTKGKMPDRHKTAAARDTTRSSASRAPANPDDVEKAISTFLADGREAEALGLMMSAYGQRVGRFILRRVRDPALADDLTQETFVRAMAGLEGFRVDSRTLTWLTRIAYNVVYTSSSRRKRRREGNDRLEQWQKVDTEEVGGVATTGAARPDRHVHKLEVMEAIDACLDRMNDVVRELAMLVWVEGHTFVEAAHITGMKEDAIRKRLTRARPVLQQCLELRGVVGCES